MTKLKEQTPEDLKANYHLPKKLFYLVQLKTFKNDEICLFLHPESSFLSKDI